MIKLFKKGEADSVSRIILITGGARSGKSSYAESIYKDTKEVVYIATSKICDEEMKDRVMMHRQSRPKEWLTFEGTYNLYEAIGDCKNYLLDCLTVLTSNIMFDITESEEKISLELQKKVENRVVEELSNLISGVKSIDGNLVMVTNEVGCSIVPESHIARVYRDIIGRINQRIACLADEVYFVACGLPLKLK